MSVVKKWKGQIPWPAIFAVFVLGALGMSVSGYSETYNFYFEKKKPDAEEAGPAAPPTQVVAPAAAPQPIVINNTNNVGTPTAVTTNNTGVAPIAPVAPVAPVAPILAAPPAAIVVADPATTRDVFQKAEARSPWHMGLTGMAFLQEYPKSYVSQGEKQSYKSLEPTWGGLVSLGYNFSKTVGINLYGGLRVADFQNKRTYAHLGADLELIPFRISISDRHDLFELGFLFGGSTALAARDNDAQLAQGTLTPSQSSIAKGSGNWGTIHAGVRVNLNVTPEFGITTSARANLGYILFEGGLSARL